MEDEFELYKEILKIPPKPVKIQQKKQAKFELTQYEMIHYQENILNSKVKTNTLLKQIKSAKHVNTSAYQYDEQLAVLEPTKYVDDLLYYQQLAVDRADRIPTYQQLELLRVYEEISPKQLGSLVGQYLTSIKCSKDEYLQQNSNSPDLSITGVRILYGKMPIREIYNITKDRVADLKPERYEKTIDYSQVLRLYESIATYLPAPKEYKERENLYAIVHNIIDLILASIPAQQYVLLQKKYLRQHISNSNYLRFDRLYYLANIIYTTSSDYYYYYYSAQLHDGDYFYSLCKYFGYYAEANYYYEYEYSYYTAQYLDYYDAVRLIEQYYRELQCNHSFTDYEVAKLAYDFGNFYYNEVDTLEEYLINRRYEKVNTIYQKLIRDYEFIYIADKTATYEDKNILKLYIPELDIYNVEYESRLDSLDSLTEKFMQQTTKLKQIFEYHNNYLVRGVLRELALTSLFKHPNEILAKNNTELYEDFLVDYNISQLPAYCEKVTINYEYIYFMTNNEYKWNEQYVSYLNYYMTSLNLNIHDKISLFDDISNNYDNIASVINILRTINYDKRYFDEQYNYIYSNITQTDSDYYQLKMNQEKLQLKTEMLKRKMDFQKIQNVPSYIVINTLPPSIFYSKMIEYIK